jgi:hypothetical protein
MSAPPGGREGAASRETRLASVPFKSAQADLEPRHDVSLGGTARSAREQRASPGRPKARSVPLGGTARRAREQQ